MKEKENLTIPSYNSLHTGTLQLLQIAFANDNEEGNEGNDFKKCEQGNVFFLTSSMRTPKPIIKQWCDPLMTFHKHCSCYSLLTLR